MNPIIVSSDSDSDSDTEQLQLAEVPFMKSPRKVCKISDKLAIIK